MKTFIFDWKRTLYDPDSQELISGARETLEFLKNKGLSLVLVGMGSREMYEEVERLGVKDYFSHINFLQERKHAALFAAFINQQSPGETVFIGDRVKSELAVGNSLGATTVWIKEGYFAAQEPESPAEQPTYTFNSLQEFKKFLERSL